ncbi:hypothetical protein DSUL_170005 [Desulfovibrionales bacterium]
MLLHADDYFLVTTMDERGSWATADFFR